MKRRIAKELAEGLCGAFLISGCYGFPQFNSSILPDCNGLISHEQWIQGGLQDVLDLELQFDKGKITANNLTRHPVYFNTEKNQPSEGYSVFLFDSDGNSLFKRKFEFSLEVFDGGMNLDRANINLYIPISPEGRRIEVYSPECERILGLDLTY